MGPLIARRFERDGDVEAVRRGISNAADSQARQMIVQSSGAERTAELARKHGVLALDALRTLPESEARAALESLVAQVLNRSR